MSILVTIFAKSVPLYNGADVEGLHGKLQINYTRVKTFEENEKRNSKKNTNRRKMERNRG